MSERNGTSEEWLTVSELARRLDKPERSGVADPDWNSERQAKNAVEAGSRSRTLYHGKGSEKRRERHTGSRAGMNDTTNEMLLRAELKAARAELETTRQQYAALCNAAMSRAQIIYGQAGTGNAPRAAELTADLLQFLTTQRYQFIMRQERQAGAYDLAALRVDFTQPSDSETGFEDRG